MQSINIPQDQFKSAKLQALKLKDLALSIQQQSFHDNTLFFDKKNLFTLINPNPQRKIKTIYDKIIVSNKSDPLHPCSYRKYETNKNRYDLKSKIASFEQKQKQTNNIIRKMNFDNMDLIDSARDDFFSDSKIVTKITNRNQEGLEKDRKKFFKNLLQKFSQNVEQQNSVNYRQRIHLFRKIFQHYKIKPQEKQHFTQLLRKITEKQSAQLYADKKISTKMNLQQRRYNWSVNQNRAVSPFTTKFRLKQKGPKTSKQKRTLKQQNNLSQILTIQSKTQNDPNRQVKNNSFLLFNDNGQRISIQQMQRQLSSRKDMFNKVQKINQQLSQDMKQIFSLNNNNVNNNIASINRSKMYDKKIQLNLQQMNKTQTPIDIKLAKFRDFLFAVNYGNNLFIPLEVEKYPTTFKIFIGKGNNSNLIKSVFKKRFWFQVTKNIQEANLVWTQLKQQQVFKRQERKEYVILMNDERQMKKKSQVELEEREIVVEIKKEQLNQLKESEKRAKQSAAISNKNKNKINSKSAANSSCLVMTNNCSSVELTNDLQPSISVQRKPNNKHLLQINNIGSIKPINQIKHPKLTANNNNQIKVQSYEQTAKRIKKHPQILLLRNMNFSSQFNNNPLSKILSTQQLSQYEKTYQKSSLNNNRYFNKTVNFNERKNDILSLGINSTIIKQQEKSKFVIHNHLPFNGILGNKKAMFYILKQYCDLTKMNLFDIVPLTFHIKQGLKDQQYKKFLETYQYRRKNKVINYWVMKPGEFSNRGNGIQCTNKIQQIKKRVQACMEKVDPKKIKKPLASKSVILQSYITNPMLYNGRKFDIRAYMMTTIVNGKIKAYWYQQGYIRTSSYIWNLSEIEDRQIHLTNDAVQKYSQTYGKYEAGNKLSYRDIQRYLQTYEKASKNVVYQKIVPEMKEIAALSLKASYLFLDPEKLQNNFQIFGFDFMLDSKLKPWLIQINTNPCLQLGCPILQRVIPNMLQNAFRIAIDPLFPPPSNFSSNYKYNIAQNAATYNKFQLIFDQGRDGPSLRKLYQHKDLNEIISNIQDIQQDKQTFEEDGQEIDLEGIKQ